MFEITIFTAQNALSEKGPNPKVNDFAIKLLATSAIEGDERFLAIGKTLAEIDRYNFAKMISKGFNSISFRVSINSEIIIQSHQTHVSDVFKHVISIEGDILDAWKIPFGYHNEFTYMVKDTVPSDNVMGYFIPDDNFNYNFHLNDGSIELFNTVKEALSKNIGAVNSLTVRLTHKKLPPANQCIWLSNITAVGAEGQKDIISVIRSHGDMANFIGAAYFKAVAEKFGLDLQYESLIESYGKLALSISGIVNPTNPSVEELKG